MAAGECPRRWSRMQVLRPLATETQASEVHSDPQLSIVLPTFNEAGNLPELFDRLLAFVRESKLAVETIVVDDASPDGTGIIAEQLAFKHNGSLSVRVIHRPSKLGLSGALYDGMHAARAPWIAMLDADNSHDIRSLMTMYRAAQDGVDVVIGSRYVAGGRVDDWPLQRRMISRGATAVADLTFRLGVKDPMSGFALIRREALSRLPPPLKPRAYKFLLELLVRGRPLNVAEVPITFQNRKKGDSKLTPKEIVEFAFLIQALVRERYLHPVDS